MPIAMILGLHGVVPALLYWGGLMAFLVAAFWRPRYGLYFLIPLLPLQTVRYRLHELPLGEKFVDIMLLGVILGMIFRRDGTSFLKTPLNRFIAILAAFLYISLWHGSFYLGEPAPLNLQDPRFSDWKNYLVMPLVFFVVASAIREVRHIKILVLLMVASFLLVNRSFYNTIKDRNLTHFSYDVRDAGPLGYAGDNGLGAFEAEFLVFLLALYAFDKKKLSKLAILAMCAFGGYCLMYTFSRGAYIAFLVGLGFLGVVKQRKWLLVMLVGLIGWQVFLPNSVQERITMTYTEEGELESSAQTRVQLWEDAMQLFRQNPILGTGFNTYSYLGRTEKYRDTHNYYLKVLVETGIVGLLVFLWLLWRMFHLGFRLFQTAEDPFLRSLGLGFAVMMVCAVAVNLFGDRWTFLQVNCFLWALLGCVVRGQLIADSTRRGSEAVVAVGSAAIPEGHPGLA